MTLTSAETERARLRQYGLDGMINGLPEMPPFKAAAVTISPDDPAWSHFFLRVSPRDVDHLKMLAGVPAEAARHPLYRTPHAAPTLKRAPDADGSIGALADDDVRDLHQMAQHILFGPHGGTALAAQPFAPVVNFMLNTARGMTVFAAKDLVVKDGETVTFDKTATLYFNTVTVYGSGKIVVGGQVKIIAETIQYIAH